MRSADVRIFRLMRDEDKSGVSGVGFVAIGVVFPSGKVVLEWLGSHSTFGIYDSITHVERIHGHGGKTRVVFMRSATSDSYPAAVTRLPVTSRIVPTIMKDSWRRLMKSS